MDLTWPGRTRTPSLVMQFPVQLMVPRAAGCCPNELGTACRCRGACQFLWLGLDQVVEVRTPRLEVSNFVMEGLGSHVHHAARFVIEFEIILCSVTVLFTFRYTLSAWSSLTGPSDLLFGITCSWQGFYYSRKLATACECVSSEAGSLVIQGCRRSANRWRFCAQRGWSTLATPQCISCCMCVCSTFSALGFSPPLSCAC